MSAFLSDNHKKKKRRIGTAFSVNLGGMWPGHYSPALDESRPISPNEYFLNYTSVFLKKIIFPNFFEKPIFNH
ncbi:hypothetical protein SAMN05216167_14627 [Spirosoma endophyticum]|uniref:Uncharacterized protein n=1 Tax=Spirosoma endophyticum TaxID=662367 RepID=A0A1I2HQ46_9BACT|nr:hypothetical protein SAMN05216167_14627 [Spirosoma endophyticum]